MLPEIGATELIVIAAVALIVVGPKDLPVLMRKVAKFMNRMRGMAAEFRNSFDEMARQSELDELRREVEAMRRGDFATSVTSDLNQSFSELDVALRPNTAELPADHAPATPAPPPVEAEPTGVEPEPAREARA